MSLTKEQKDWLISNIYAPVYDYIAAVVGEDTKEEKKPSFLRRLFTKKVRSYGFGLAFDLSQAARSKWEARAKFESRISAIIDAYLEGRVLAEPIPSPEPVTVVDESKRQEFIATTMQHLADFKWADLKSEDYVTARRAWFFHDWLLGVCVMNPETKEAYKKAREEAKID